MRTQLETLKNTALDALKKAADIRALEELRVRFLGKKGELTAVLKQMGALAPEERPVIGGLANDLRALLEEAIENASKRLEKAALSARLRNETVDVTMPGRAVKLGRRHPMSIVIDEVYDIFLGMGFSVADGPEVETTYYCFDALNTFEGHPARDERDTFYFDEKTILRTQTSSVQIRTMEKTKPPIRIISPGRTYRKDEIDATHSPMFHQIEGLVVDSGITMADLKGCLETLMKGLYGAETRLRFRPHHFPYTEPSAEVDLQCFVCGGKGCRMCKGEGWIELLGAGMVHPQVLRNCDIDPEVYSGFAFGVGIERLALMRFDITDMRLLFENDVRFLRQFV
ncbi:MAG: phenylalanine--tRNA ligase subunit alpha [Oscillospiraceae bacterium]|jgi:phenylalanyl-tRNA synthetase alpha chain|nr:phenylalanine--tRNA ligase subunit alpha [Oscillospiraceae bacterium]